MKYIYSLVVVTALASGMFVSCKNDTKTTTNDGIDENMTYGNLTLYTDATVQPIVEDVVAVFGSIYNKAHITQVNKSESEIVNAMIRDSAHVAVLTRLLTDEEQSNFTKTGIKPKITHFATDALALVTNKTATDSVINLEEVYKVLQGNPTGKIKQLVFDSAGSSTIQMLMKEAGVSKIPSKNVYSLKSTQDVIKFVHDNAGSIGVVGVNWLVQAPPQLEKYVENIKVLGVDNVKIDKGAKKYYKPSQSNIGAGLYPLTRKLYLLNYQGKLGLGMGFANYVTAPDGQRIILKSGLLPVEIPPRELEVRNEL
jgi:phosphate transport system substrate-binding protein